MKKENGSNIKTETEHKRCRKKSVMTFILEVKKKQQINNNYNN